MVLSGVQMFAQGVRHAAQMFAGMVAILRDKYLEIGPLEGEWNREIEHIRAKVPREFPINTSRWASERVLHANSRGLSREFAVVSGQWSAASGQWPAASQWLVART